jgi:metallopeptidase MepB
MEVTILFHELGHGIHDLVSKTKYARFHGSAGTVIDFGEAPSQVLENWFLIPSELKRLSRHYSSLSDDYLKIWREKKAAAEGQPFSEKAENLPLPELQLPDHMIADLLRSRGINRALGELGQLCMSIWDFTLHDQESHEAVEKMNMSEAYNRLHSETFPRMALSTRVRASSGPIRTAPGRCWFRETTMLGITVTHCKLRICRTFLSEMTCG